MNDNEVKVFIEALQELACNPFMEDGWWIQKQLHEWVTQDNIPPTFEKQVSPYLESKVKWLKSKYHAITDMCKESDYQ